MASIPPNASWPTWTDSTVGNTAVNVQIGWSVDETFDKLWGPSSEFSAHVREARNIKDYSESPWVTDSTLMEQERTGVECNDPCFSRGFPSHTEYAGHSRKVTFSQGGSSGLLKSAYTNEEVQRCVEAVEGDRYTMHCTIATNAPYGDRVRIILKYHLQAAGTPEKPLCNLQVLYDVVYVKPTNWGLKGVIGSGVDMGVKKNFATLRDLLSEMVAVLDMEDVGVATTLGPDSQSTGTTLDEPRHPKQQLGLFLWLSASETSMRKAAKPVAELLRRQGLFFTGGLEAAASCLSAAVMIALMWAILSVKSVLVAPVTEFCTVEGCHPGTGQVVCFLYSIGDLMDLPDSVREVAGSVLLLALMQRLSAFVLSAIKREDPAPSQPAAVSTEERDVLSGSGVTPPPADQSESTSAAGETNAKSAVKKQLENIKSGLKDISSSVRELATSSSTANQRVRAKSSGAAVVGPSAQNRSPGKAATPNAREEQDQPSNAVIFENERYQPIRGWGHTWPGHFMPRDFSHWSTLSDDSSMVFADVCPTLPDGYGWVDAEWTVDMSGQEDEAVDAEGWSYGIHWNKLTYPPQPGTGRRKGALFVRRRKWVRKWAPHPDGAAFPEPDFKQPSTAALISETNKDHNDSDTSRAISATLATVGGILRGHGSKEPTRVVEPEQPVPTPAAGSNSACSACPECTTSAVEPGASLAGPEHQPPTFSRPTLDAISASVSSNSNRDEGVAASAAGSPLVAELDAGASVDVADPGTAQIVPSQPEMGSHVHLRQSENLDQHPESALADLDDSFELAAALAEISSTMETSVSNPGVSLLDADSITPAMEESSHQSDHSEPLLPVDDLHNLPSFSPAEASSSDADNEHPCLYMLTGSLLQDTLPSSDDTPQASDKQHCSASHLTGGIETPRVDSTLRAEVAKDDNQTVDGKGAGVTSASYPSLADKPISEVINSDAPPTDPGGINPIQEGAVPGSHGLGTKFLLAKQSADDASAKLMRAVQSSKFGEKLSGAVGKVGSAMVKTGENVPDGKTRSSPDAPIARSISASADTGIDLSDLEPSPLSDNSMGWHKRAVSDMRKLAGEVSIDTMGGAAQRVGAEMNVAAKKLTGEMGDAAKKLQGLFGRTGTKFGGLGKGSETGADTTRQDMSNLSASVSGMPSQSASSASSAKSSHQH
mmetsp:Transcript_32521/g.92225  ORF Transcript_32521/g.92225 Transcript_32521/m.92225 type:complete len:1170 (-) Transcript_32521:1244-4753(-)|eukprot:CAMPEP_0117658162 /NCGR_PEP_ID=MMETSP0804-20121206/5718_1 /TAXON_ID=1074897 /ORGANISM="Tetraselmis astigmatica, Strain CCMP880" /LENGTH=1169 /DNA_ID=CAMNT_0005464667 /DNA_START=239 /DNA_END=3748 /DNA_ORIENTATION=+